MADADARVRSIRSELKVARMAADRRAIHERMEGRWAGLTLRSSRVALSVYVHTGFDGECARRFCVRARQKRKIDLAYPNADFPVEEWFHGTPLDDIVAISHPRTDYEESIQSEARRFMAEDGTAAWVSRCNFEHEVAPGLRTVLAHFHMQLNRLEAAHRPLLVPLSDADTPDRVRSNRTRSLRRWGQRFRDRYGFRFGRLPRGYILPVELAVRKAPGPDSFAGTLAGEGGGGVWGGSKKGMQMYYNVKRPTVRVPVVARMHQ
jgi:hypothetical protein